MYLKNLCAAIRVLLASKTFIEFLLNLDRLGNALAGGDFRATVSARVGYFALTKSNPYWLALQKIIDNCFHPWEGPRHCYRAFIWEQEHGKTKYRRSSDVALTFLSVLVFACCLMLFPVIYIVSLFDPRTK